MPAQAGIQSRRCHCGDSNNLDSRFRGNDGTRKTVPVKYVTVIANSGAWVLTLLFRVRVFLATQAGRETP